MSPIQKKYITDLRAITENLEEAIDHFIGTKDYLKMLRLMYKQQMLIGFLADSLEEEE